MKKNNKIIERLFRSIKNNLNSMTDLEFLSCDEFKNMIRSQLLAMLRRNEKLILEIVSELNNDTAWTDKITVHCNTWSPLVINQANRYLMYLANIGSAAHEMGHVFYTNFPLLNKIRKQIYERKYEFKQYQEYIKRDIRIQNFFANEMNGLVNIVEDCYDEHNLCKDFPKEGIVVQGLNACNKCKYELSGSLYDLEKRVADGEIVFVSLGVAMIQIYCTLGYVPKDFDKCSGPIHDKLVEFLNKANPIVKLYRDDANFHEKCIKDLVELCYTLLPAKDEDFFNDPNGQFNQDGNDENSEDTEGAGSSQSGSNESSSNASNSDSNSGNNSDGSCDSDEVDDTNGASDSTEISDEEKEQKLEKLTKASEELKKSSGVSKEAKGENEGMRRTYKNEEADSKGFGEKSSKDNIVDQSNRFISEMAENKLSEEIQKENKKANEKNIEDARERFFPSSYLKVVDASGFVTRCRNEVKYRNYYEQIKDVSKKCQRRIKQILEVRPDDEYDSGHLMGSRFNVNDVYKKDGKYFSKEVVPADQPDVAFSVMVDCSGSMNGRKMDNAVKTAVLFEDICRGLNIPFKITGHEASGDRILLYPCVDFNASKDDKYNICNLEAGSYNVDAHVVNVLANELSKRQEKSKVLIVISDGLPCGDNENTNNFKGIPYKNNPQLSNKEMQKLNAVVRYWRKKQGIEIIGVAIDDSTKIKAIYEEQFLDCTDLNKLPSEMVKIFKKYVLK